MNQTIPLFPLSAHLLPGGKLSLRIFEPRYVRMVKEACANNTEFGMCMLNSKGDKELNQHILPIGTFAKVIDFDLLEDGMLGITVEGLRCFRIVNIKTENDGLRVGECEPLAPWQIPSENTVIAPIDNRLKEIFDKYPEIHDQYPYPHFEDPIWVIYRWLELIPIKAEQKQILLKQNDCVKALQYLTQLVQ